jgi:hypothetical protein
MSWSLSGNVITLDAGTTENDLSGLSSITGVTTTTDTGAIYYDLGTLQMIIKGTLYHDPDEEVLIMHHEHTTGNSGGGYQRGLIVNSGGTYYYGKETTAYGRTRLSSGCGLFITGNGFTFWEPWDNGFVVSGTFVARGGVIHTSRSLTMPGVLDIKDLTILNNDDNYTMEIRDVATSGNGSTIDNLKLIKIDPLDPWKVDNKQSYNFKEGAVARKYGTYREFELFDVDFSENTRGSDIRHTGSYQHNHMDVHIVNSASGSDMRMGWRLGTSSWMGSNFVHKQVSFNLKDSAGSNISGCKVYLEDNPSQYKKEAIFKYQTGAGNNNISADATLSRGVYSTDATNTYMTYDYTTPIVYDKTTDANGDVATFKVLTAVTFYEALPSDSTYTQYSPNPFNSQWRETDNAIPAFADIGTTRFGGFFMPDYRSDSNSTADDFTFKFCSYDHSLSKSTQTLKGIGELEVSWVLFEDQLITDTKATADAYTEIDTPQKFYNKAKAYLVDNYAGETSTIVAREGNSIDAGSYDVVVDASASSVFAISGNTLTIKATTFVGNISTTGTTTLSNGAVVVGTFGSTTVLPWEVKNIEGTSRIQLYNTTSPREGEVVNTKYSSTDPFIDVSGTYTSTEIAVGDVVRLRVTCVVGATALLPVVLTGVATTSGITFQVDQEADTIYNSNGVDASQITTFTADYTNTPMGIDLSETDGVATVQELYAYLVYAQTTEDGVDKWFNAVRAIDGSNYQIDQTIADIRFQNVGSVAVNITGGRIFRKDGSSVLYAEQGNYPISLDTGSLIANIQPQIESVLNTNAKMTAIDNNSKLIPGLL